MGRSIAIDASSKTIGWTFVEDGKPKRAGTYPLTGPIGKRVLRAYEYVTLLITLWEGVELLKFEAPAFRFKGSGIPQLRVSGAIILACEHRGVAYEEVTPTSAKKALSGSGKTEKAGMLRAAGVHLGYDPATLEIIELKRDYWVARINGEVVFDEHSADAVGVWLGEGKPVK